LHHHPNTRPRIAVIMPLRLFARTVIVGRLACTAALLTLAPACHRMGGPVPQPDIATVKTSAHGVYTAAVRPSVDPIPVHRLQSWTLHVETAQGQAVDQSTITVDGRMPQHGHGLPTKPRVTRALGGGDHLVEGMKFNMGGWWVVRFAITSSAGVDTVTFNLSL
jgi:hypothetical protein